MSTKQRWLRLARGWVSRLSFSRSLSSFSSLIFCLSSLSWCLSSVALLSSVARAAANPGPRLLLAGGALPVCSSASASACIGRAPVSANPEHGYQLDSAALGRIGELPWLAHRQVERQTLLTAFARWQTRLGPRAWQGDTLTDLLAREDRQAHAAWTALADFEQYQVMDVLQVSVASEVVRLADSRSDSGAEVFRTFVAMARTVSGRERPRILVSTASSRDPFEAIAFYLAVFEQAGAEVRWLPLDAAMRSAQASRRTSCDTLDSIRAAQFGAADRARLYPDRATELRQACASARTRQSALAWADGIFLNGGDQSLTRAAWFDRDGTPSADLQWLQKRLDAGGLVVGGTSAGTAVQASHQAPMLISGRSLPRFAASPLRTMIPDPSCAKASACAGVDPDALWVHPEGGLGTFPLGALDTHFSQRGRDYRLARVLVDMGQPLAAADTGQPLAIGVDETTALRLDWQHDRWQAQVIGQGGATWLVRTEPDTVLWQRQYPGAAMTWPRTLIAPHCNTTLARTLEIEAGAERLAEALANVSTLDPVQLILKDAEGSALAGVVCGSADGIRRWQLPPLPPQRRIKPKAEPLALDGAKHAP